jgi:diamine N-acetyltransferase
MIIQTKNNRQVLLRRLKSDDFDKLFDYLHHLGPETKKRFGPHMFDKKSIIDFYENAGKHRGYIAQDTGTLEIIAYSIIKIGYLEHDSSRLRSYGLTLDNKTDCAFAPSVADQWQSIGLGNSLFNFILSNLKTNKTKRIILWGGVQCDNYKAVNFYIKNGFRTLGQFEYNGLNYDMILEIS